MRRSKKQLAWINLLLQHRFFAHYVKHAEPWALSQMWMDFPFKNPFKGLFAQTQSHTWTWTFAHSPFHSHSAYWKCLVSWREWTCGHTGASPTVVRRCCVCSSAILLKEAQTQRQTEGKRMFVVGSTNFAASQRGSKILLELSECI